MNPDLNPREKTAFGIAALAILLRLASDWLFASGGPLPYQMLQAILLVLAACHFETPFGCSLSQRPAAQAVNP